jgi:CRISP-associated protein Cas1
MIHYPDFKEKQIVFIETSYNIRTELKFNNECLVVYKEDKIVNKISCSKIFTLIIIGDLKITTNLIKKLQDYAINTFFVSYNFEWYASIECSVDSNFILRQKQYTLTMDEELEIAKKIVLNKTANQLKLLKADHKYDISDITSQTKKQITQVSEFKELLGIEGEVSKLFFSHFFKDLNWIHRQPQVKADIPNFLLDIGYTYLFHFVDTILRLHGFDTYKGFYHRLFFERKSLACDIMETFRCLIDYQLAKSYHLQQIEPKDFMEIDGKIQFKKYEFSRKYQQIFISEILKEKNQIYKYIHEFYRYFMDKDKNKFPKFLIKT